MRTSFVMAILLLAGIIAGGLWAERHTAGLADQYVSAAEEIRIMTEKNDWLRARETVSAYIDAWKDTTPWLQILINHDDIDDVTLALMRLQAAVAVRDASLCRELCAELREDAQHIHHRDAFSLGNVL